MATRKGAKGGRPAEPAGDVDLSTHPLVAEHNVDPSEIEPPPPELSSLVGYLGPSRRDGSIRLYRDLTFRNFYEIPTAGVVSTKPLNPDDENSPTLVQVEPDTKVEVVNVSVQSVEARYLSGSISGGLYGAAAGGAGGAQAAGPICGNITTYMPSCLAQQQPCTNITTHMPSCVGQGGAGDVQAAGAQTLCTNITTYMPSCVRHMCTNITTHMPSCVGGPGPQVTGPATACTIVMTTMACTFGGAEAGTVAAAGPGGGFCTNITTHMPSCVHCNLNCIATIVTSGVPGGGGQACIDLYTANPSHCAQQCDPNCVATVVTSHHAPAAFAARGVQPTPPQFCITRFTANPTDCGGPPMCLTVVTANPTDCGPCMTVVTANPTDCGRTVEAAALYQAGGNVAVGGAGAQFCLVTRNPTNCGPVYCATYYTARPSNCGPVYCATITYPTRGPICHVGGLPTRIVCNTNFPSCLQEVTATIVNDPGPLARGGFAQAQAAPPPMCITLHTAAPTWCDPCQPIANTAATLCTQHITTPQDRGICPTVYTVQPTGGCG